MTAQICDSALSAVLNLLASAHREGGPYSAAGAKTPRRLEDGNPRDGGQYTADHGIEKSCQDAEIEFYRLSRMLTFCMDFDELLSRNKDAKTIGEWISAYWTISNMRAHLERIKR